MSEQNTLLGVLSYLGPLVIISYILGNQNAFVKFHVKQGLALFILEIIVYVLGMFFFWHFWFIYELLNLLTLVLAIIGIVNVLQNKEKSLPLVGQFAHSFKI